MTMSPLTLVRRPHRTRVAAWRPIVLTSKHRGLWAGLIFGVHAPKGSGLGRRSTGSALRCASWARRSVRRAERQRVGDGVASVPQAPCLRLPGRAAVGGQRCGPLARGLPFEREVSSARAVRRVSGGPACHAQRLRHRAQVWRMRTRAGPNCVNHGRVCVRGTSVIVLIGRCTYRDCSASVSKAVHHGRPSTSFWRDHTSASCRP